MILWTYDPPERDARLAREALQTIRKGINRLHPIIEIACAPSSPHHLIAVRQAYCALYDCSLEEDICSTIDLPIRKVEMGNSRVIIPPASFVISIEIVFIIR